MTRRCLRFDVMRPIVCTPLHTGFATDMSHRINVIVQEDVWRFLREVPQGDRSRTINAALREWARGRRRFDAAADMDRLRSEAKAAAVTADEVVRWIREERDGGH